MLKEKNKNKVKRKMKIVEKKEWGGFLRANKFHTHCERGGGRYNFQKN
jgi:hypothetical protein